jgi:hypothetical protein
MFPDGKTHNQNDHILIDRQRNSSVLDARSSRATDCDTDHYLLVAKVRERLAVGKQRPHIFRTKRLNLKKLNEAKYRQQYHVEVLIEIWSFGRFGSRGGYQECLGNY